MKKPFILLILTIASFSLFAQESTIDAKTIDYKKIQIGIILSPDFCFRKLKNNGGGNNSDMIITLRNDYETYKNGYTAGLNFCFNINRSFGIESGVHYSNKGYQTKELFLSLTDKVKFIYNYHYIDIPLKAKVSFGKRKTQVFTSIGILTNIFFKESQTTLKYSSTKTDKNSITLHDGIKKINISPTISVGVDFKLNSKMNLKIEPSFSYGLTKINDTPLTEYLYGGGLNVSYYVGF